MNSLTVLFLISFTIISCKTSTNTPASSDLIPLKTGNEWIYQTNSYDRSGNITTTITDTTTISSDLIAQGMTWHYLSPKGIGGFISNRNNGLWSFDTATQKVILLYEYPSFSGNSYVAEYDSVSYNLGGKSIFQISIKIISTNEEVSTPAGVFSCYHFQYEADDTQQHGDVTSIGIYAQDVYIAPDIGLVMVTEPKYTNGSQDGSNILSLLKEYHLK